MMVLGLGLGVRPAGSVTSPDPVAPSNILLAEDGSSLLAEDGSNILVES